MDRPDYSLDSVVTQAVVGNALLLASTRYGPKGNVDRSPCTCDEKICIFVSDERCDPYCAGVCEAFGQDDCPPWL